MFNRIYLKFLRWRGWPALQRRALPNYAPAERRALIASLAEHPGFQYLMAHLENSKVIYESRGGRGAIAAGQQGLDGVIRNHTEAVRNEEAIFWIGWLQWTVKKYSAMPLSDKPTDNAPDEDAIL